MQSVPSRKEQKNPLSYRSGFSWVAEEEGFEPPDLLQSTVFKTAAIDHSAILPRQKYVTSPLCKECLFWDFFFSPKPYGDKGFEWVPTFTRTGTRKRVIIWKLPTAWSRVRSMPLGKKRALQK